MAKFLVFKHDSSNWCNEGFRPLTDIKKRIPSKIQYEANTIAEQLAAYIFERTDANTFNWYVPEICEWQTITR